MLISGEERATPRRQPEKVFPLSFGRCRVQGVLSARVHDSSSVLLLSFSLCHSGCRGSRCGWSNPNQQPHLRESREPAPDHRHQPGRWSSHRQRSPRRGFVPPPPKGQPLRTRLLEASRVVSPKELAVFPLPHTPDRMQSISTLEPTRDVWRNMFVEKELQHYFSVFLLFSK